MLVIGSLPVATTLKRSPADIDIIMTPAELEVFKETVENQAESFGPNGSKWIIKTDSLIYDIEIATPGSTGEALLTLLNNEEFAMTRASMDVIYTLKMSHRYRKNNSHFYKTMTDIHLLRDAGAKIFNKAWLKERERVTYDYKHPSLEKNKDDFFGEDANEYRFDHDRTHVEVANAHGHDGPAYLEYADPEHDVRSLRSLFEALPLETRLRGAMEEACVLAIERSVVPHDTKPNDAFIFALQKVATSITSGWFREFTWENFDAIVAMYLGKPDLINKAIASLVADEEERLNND